MTIRYWLPVAVIVAAGVAAYYGYREYKKVIPPERKHRLAIITSEAICYAMKSRMPYRFEKPVSEWLVEKATLLATRIDGADIISIPLTIMEKSTEQIDLNLLYEIFLGRLERYSKLTAGVGVTPVSDQIPVLRVIDVTQRDYQITVKILIVDSRAALKYLDKIIRGEDAC